MSEIHAAVGSYVVHALDENDRLAFDAHLSNCPPCQVEVAELSETVAELGWLVRQRAPDVVRHSVLSHVNEVRPLPPLAVPVRTPPHPASTTQPMNTQHTTRQPTITQHTSSSHSTAKPGRRVVAFALAAAFVAVVGLGGTVLTLDHQRQDLLVSTQAQMQLLTAPDAKVYPGTVGSDAAVSFVVSKSRDQAMFVADDLPALDADHAYQLWSMMPQGAMPSTVFTSSGDVQVWMKPGIRMGTGIALTIEPAGGSSQPTTQPLVTESL